LTPEQLQPARAERWRQKQNPALTLDEASAWVSAMGLCLFLPRRNQFLTPAPSFTEAAIGAPSDTPAPAEIENARGLMIRLTESGTALPLNLLGTHTDQPDFLASGEAFPYIFTLRGGRNWKTPPPKATPLVVEIWKLLEPGASLEATEIQAALGRELTEAAVLRGLMDLWSGLRVMPVYTQDGPTRWELTQVRFTDAMNAANKIAQTTGLSALVSLYLESVIAATPEEIEIFLSSLTARSKVREVVNGLAATRQIAIVPVGTQTMYHVAGSLPEFAEPERPHEPETTRPKPEFETRRSFRGQRPSFERGRPQQRPSSRPPAGPPSRERFAARKEDRGERPRPPREGERRESRPFRKFDPGKRPERYSPKTRESGTEASAGERKPFRPRPFDDARRGGGKFPPKKFGAERGRPRFGEERDRPAKKFGSERERPQFGTKGERPPKKFGGPQKFSGKRPFFREKREGFSADQRPGRPPRQDTGLPPRKGEWKPSRFGKSGKPQPGGTKFSGPKFGRAESGGPRPGGSPFKGPRRDQGDQRGEYRSGQKQTGGRPGSGKFGEKKFGGSQKKFGGPQSRGKSAGGRPGFKSGPKPGGAKPPFRDWKDKKWKNKGKKDDGKKSE
jgi:23S rRNA pseudouridine2605 synthase